MKDNRFPKKALDNLIALDLSANNDKKQNWFSFLIDWIQDLEAIGDNNASQIQEIIRKKEVIITKGCSKCHEENRSRSLMFSYCENYKFLKNIHSRDWEEYLTLKLPLSIVSTFAQPRLAGNKGLKLRNKNISYDIDYRIKCPVCNINEKETLNHIVKSCPYTHNFEINS